MAWVIFAYEAVVFLRTKRYYFLEGTAEFQVAASFPKWIHDIFKQMSNTLFKNAASFSTCM